MGLANDAWNRTSVLSCIFISSVVLLEFLSVWFHRFLDLYWWHASFYPFLFSLCVFSNFSMCFPKCNMGVGQCGSFFVVIAFDIQNLILGSSLIIPWFLLIP